MSFQNEQKILDNVPEDEREYLSPHDDDDLRKLPAIICAMSNGVGGVVIFENPGEDFDVKVPENIFSARIIWKKYRVDFPEKKIILRIFPANYYDRPVRVRRFAYRRCEGENFISGKTACAKIASDAMDFAFDDAPVNLELDSKSLENFRGKVISNNPELAKFNGLEFLKRTHVYSGKFLTEAGVLLLGCESVCVNLDLSLTREKTVHLRAGNLWNAYFHMLPRIIVPNLRKECAEALREIFTNALLHTDYRLSRNIMIRITSSPAKISIRNSCCNLRPNRNYRLMQIFRLLNAAKGESSGMQKIRNYDGNFELRFDALNFEVESVLRLQPSDESENLENFPDALIL